MRFNIRSLAAAASLITLLVVLSGCASNAAAPEDRSPADPWEPLNRSIHNFNGGLDAVTLKPLAKGYQAITPAWARHGITNFYLNLRTSLNIINQFLQGKPRDGFSETGRLLVNSTLGIGGLLDVATEYGLERKPEDFGQTLAVWGVPDGPFVVVPFLGPFTLRDAFAIPLNIYGDLLIHYDNSSVRDKLYLLRAINLRQRLFAAESLLADSQDKYLTIRESWLQHRQYEIYDGDPPVDDDFYDEFLDEEFMDEER